MIIAPEHRDDWWKRYLICHFCLPQVRDNENHIIYMLQFVLCPER